MPAAPARLAPRLSPRYAASRRAFTLIELLVVMAILASLAAILIPVIGAARRAAKIAGAKHLLGQIDSAIESFEADWGSFPPDDIPSGTRIKRFTEDGADPDPETSYTTFPGSCVPAEALYYCLCNPYATGKHPYLQPQTDLQATDVDRDRVVHDETYSSTKNDVPEIVDPWDTPFQYHRGEFPSGTTLPALFADESGVADDLSSFDDGVDPTHNPDAFDLWSPGPPGTGDPAVIANWK
jgi:prepilin-type N-terminal cleavage/methylation domain-containing protein